LSVVKPERDATMHRSVLRDVRGARKTADARASTNTKRRLKEGKPDTEGKKSMKKHLKGGGS